VPSTFEDAWGAFGQAPPGMMPGQMPGNWVPIPGPSTYEQAYGPGSGQGGSLFIGESLGNPFAGGGGSHPSMSGPMPGWDWQQDSPFPFGAGNDGQYSSFGRQSPPKGDEIWPTWPYYSEFGWSQTDVSPWPDGWSPQGLPARDWQFRDWQVGDWKDNYASDPWFGEPGGPIVSDVRVSSTWQGTRGNTRMANTVQNGFDLPGITLPWVKVSMLTLNAP
jgi:hypothetical protein